MKPRKLAVSERETAEFPDIMRAGIFFRVPASKQVTAERTVCPGNASAQTRRRTGRRQGLKILAREANNIAARIVPNSQAEWSWDCTTPRTAPTGITVPDGASRFSRKIAPPESFFIQTRRTQSALKGHGFQPCRYRVRMSWPFGPEGGFPPRLKPGARKGAVGAPEGVPLQRRTEQIRTGFEPFPCATAALPVSHSHVCAAE